jgi:hypothetical protein
VKLSAFFEIFQFVLAKVINVGGRRLFTNSSINLWTLTSLIYIAFSNICWIYGVISSPIFFINVKYIARVKLLLLSFYFYDYDYFYLVYSNIIYIIRCKWGNDCYFEYFVKLQMNFIKHVLLYSEFYDVGLYIWRICDIFSEEGKYPRFRHYKENDYQFWDSYAGKILMNSYKFGNLLTLLCCRSALS